MTRQSGAEQGKAVLPLTTYVNRDLHAWANAQAARQGRSASGWLAWILGQLREGMQPEVKRDE